MGEKFFETGRRLTTVSPFSYPSKKLFSLLNLYYAKYFLSKSKSSPH